MITQLTLENFKSFINATIDFSPLTVLTGMNASGKSSVIQAIRMVKQSCGEGRGNPTLSDHVMPNQLKSKLTKDDFYKLSFVNDGKTYATHVDSIRSESFRFIVNDGLRYKEIENIHYISADRYGPKNQLLAGNVNEVKDVGENGEFVISFIDKNQYTKVSHKMVINPDSENLFDNINSWLAFVAKDSLLSYEKNQAQNVYYPFYNGIVPTETGYGLSYTLPVIASLLYTTEKSQTILIENPEAHLHPAAQTKLGELIALAVTSNKQIIIETHSDHIIDGIRIAAKQNKIKSSDVKFHFFRKDGFDKETVVETPEVNQDGKLSFWPEGFFDQGLKDKAILARK